MSEAATWYVVKVAATNCQIMTQAELESVTVTEQWGPYQTEGEAIAKRVGLIRAGKCQPV